MSISDLIRNLARRKEMAQPEIQLGDVARDTITGFEGTVIARTEWLNGCWRLVLQGKVDKDGKVPDGISIDAPQLELVSRKGHVADKKTGGPRPEPRRTGL